MEEKLLIGEIIILILVAAYIAIALVVFFGRRKFQRLESYVILSVQVSRENELGPIVAEHIFSTLHTIDNSFSWWQRIVGVDRPAFSFEIAHIAKQIKFYFRVPVRLRSLVEGQIYAQYPDVEITEVKDFSVADRVEVETKVVLQETKIVTAETKAVIHAQNKSTEILNREYDIYNLQHHALGIELGMISPDIYPIKRYAQFEDKLTRVAVDPIAGITAVFSNLASPYDQVWMQLVIRPLSDKWRKVYLDCVRILNKGTFSSIDAVQKAYARLYCKRKSWIRLILFPVYVWFYFQGLFSASKGMKIDLMSGKAIHDSDELAEEMSRTHERETPVGAALDKVSKLLFESTIRLVYIPKSPDLHYANNKIREMAGAFKQFNIPQLNGFMIGKVYKAEEIVRRYRERRISEPMVMNPEELATIFHLPNKIVMTPNIYWVRSKKLEPPSNLPSVVTAENDDFTLLGRTNFRGNHEEFGIKTLDRRRHIYIIGKTGMGKSTLLENMIFSDIQRGKGLAVVDPHGDLADNIMNFIPSWRTNHVIVFDPSDRDFPVAFNMLENVDPSHNSIVCSGLVGIFKKLYADSWGPRLEHILRNTILALLEYPNTTMLGITRMLQDRDFRRKVVAKITDPVVKAFWLHEFEKMSEKQMIEAISPILNKVGQFLSSPIIRNIVGQPQSSIDFRFAMDRGKIVVVNLSKGKLGEDMSSLLGSMIITKFQLDAMSRADIPEAERKDFYLYVDEFQNFATDSFATILSEARKYRLNLTMANQYIAQMPEEVRDAVFGNVGTIVSFQLGFTDAEFLALQFSEEVTENDLVGLSKFSAYTRLLVDGMPTKTFSFATLPPPSLPEEEDRRQKIINVSRQKYAAERLLVEDKIKRWHEVLPKRLIAGNEQQKT